MKMHPSHRPCPFALAALPARSRSIDLRGNVTHTGNSGSVPNRWLGGSVVRWLGGCANPQPETHASRPENEGLVPKAPILKYRIILRGQANIVQIACAVAGSVPKFFRRRAHGLRRRLNRPLSNSNSKLQLLYRQALRRGPRPRVPDAQLPRGSRQVADRGPAGVSRRVECVGVLHNGVTGAVDLWGCKWVLEKSWDTGLSDPSWEQISSTGPSADERWDIMTRYGVSAWIRPYQHSGVEEMVGPVVARYEKITEDIWYKNTTTVYSYTRVDTLGMKVTTKEPKDDPSLLNAVAELVLTFVSKITGPVGGVVGLASDVISVADAAEEIREYIKQYGVDTMWDVEFGTITFAKERRRCWGFLLVNE